MVPPKQPKPPGPDQPISRRGSRAGAGRAAAVPPGSRSGPSGEGWDDGRGHRSAGDRPTARRSDSGRPGWLLPAGAAGVALVLLIGFLALRGGGGPSDGGRCLDELLAHVPEVEGTRATEVTGTDFVQARSAGYDEDGSLEELGSSLAETGTIPDRLTARFRIDRLLSVEAFTARTGVRPGDVRCAIAAGDRSVMSGSFDAAEVGGSDVGGSGDVKATDDFLAYVTGTSADPDDLLTPVKDKGLAGDEALAAVLRSLRENGAYSVAMTRNGSAKAPVQVAGIGVGGKGDERTLVVAWSFRTADAAKVGRAEVIDRLNTLAQGTTTLASADLEIDGNLVTGVVDARRAPDLAELLDRGLLPTTG